MGATVVQNEGLYQAMFFGHWLIFLGAPVALFRSGHPIVGGLLMLLSTLMPLAGQAWFTDSDMPGLAFLLIIEVPVALIVLLAGLAMSLPTACRRFRSKDDQRRGRYIP